VYERNSLLSLSTFLKTARIPDISFDRLAFQVCGEIFYMRFNLLSHVERIAEGIVNVKEMMT